MNMQSVWIIVMLSNGGICLPKTILAHIYKDGFQFIHPDEKQEGNHSLREAARIKSFPDDFVFW